MATKTDKMRSDFKGAVSFRMNVLDQILLMTRFSVNKWSKRHEIRSFQCFFLSSQHPANAALMLLVKTKENVWRQNIFKLEEIVTQNNSHFRSNKKRKARDERCKSIKHNFCCNKWNSMPNKSAAVFFLS